MKEARIKLGLTQTQLADELGVKQNTVYRWESGLLAVPKMVRLAIETLLNRMKTRAGKKAAKKSSNKSSE